MPETSAVVKLVQQQGARHFRKEVGGENVRALGQEVGRAKGSSWQGKVSPFVAYVDSSAVSRVSMPLGQSFLDERMTAGCDEKQCQCVFAGLFAARATATDIVCRPSINGIRVAFRPERHAPDGVAVASQSSPCRYLGDFFCIGECSRIRSQSLYFVGRDRLHRQTHPWKMTNKPCPDRCPASSAARHSSSVTEGL